jgi:hypothetical protein
MERPQAIAKQVRGWEKWTVAALVLVASSAPSVAQIEKPADPQAAGPRYSAPANLTGDQIIEKMLERNRLRNEQLQRYSVVRTYEIRNLEGKLAAQTVVRVEYQAPETKTFQKTSEKGSGIVRHLVFDRLLESEGEASSYREHHSSAITTENYAFTPAGEESVGAYHCFVLEVTPKRRDKYLFEGKVWIDATDFAIVKIAGHPAKKPSFWVNRADFVRQYQRIDGFWLPLRDETSVEVRIYGRKLFTVDHQLYVINPSLSVEAKTERDGDPK